MKKTVLALLIALSLNAQAGNLTVQVNTNTVVEGDSFQLVISTDGRGGEPDLSPLQKDFTILGRSQSSNISIINGNMSKKLQWIVTLSPKHQGELDIPAIHVGNEHSKAFTIQVVDASQAPNSQGASNGITLTTRINGSGEQFYVFQAIPLTVRIETSQPILQASIVKPQPDGAELSKSGQVRQSQITHNGRVIHVIEQDYLLRAQQAGDLSIKPFTLKGEVPDGSPRRDPFAEFDDFFGGHSPFGGFGMQRGKPFSVRSNPLTLTIEGKATANASQWFLPAKAVELQATWPVPNPTFTVGEPVTREIQLLALGAQPEQLPTIDIPDINGIRTYIDSDITDSVQTADGSVARRVVTLSVVPEYGGDFTLPEITVDWHNTSTGKAEVATLPAEPISVSGAPAPVASQPTGTKIASVAANKTVSRTSKAHETVWWWIGSGGALGLGVLALVLWFRRRPSSPLANQQTQRKTLSKAIKTAAEHQNANALYQALLAWKQSGLETNETFNAMITHVEAALFHKGKLDFQYVNKTLDAAVLASTTTAKQANRLPELYRT